MELRRHYAVEAKGKTQAEFFKDVEVGDRLRASIKLKDNVRYSPQVTVENLTQGTKRTDVMGRMYSGLFSLKLRELD
jgi:hypothetical protein